MTRAPRRLRKRHALGELREVVDETIALFHRLAWVAEQIYGRDGRSLARRGLLRGLERYGARTVPQLAKARSVRRQTLQPVVDELTADGLVELVDNPDHARSKLVRITPAGRAIVERMDRADVKVLEAVGAGLSEPDLKHAAETLRAVRARFEAEMRWRPVIEEQFPEGR
ncbi:MAG: MarR family transcriptional regulator [Deltaproteobacteria bacterium]|nr:MarR family transcriptional regulator [Deltaproteobacteria bacterium]